MGLFTTYLAYRSEKKRSQRRHDDEMTQLIESAEEICDNCGYRRVQHDDVGRCPRYD